MNDGSISALIVIACIRHVQLRSIQLRAPRKAAAQRALGQRRPAQATRDEACNRVGVSKWVRRRWPSLYRRPRYSSFCPAQLPQATRPVNAVGTDDGLRQGKAKSLSTLRLRHVVPFVLVFFFAASDVLSTCKEVVISVAKRGHLQVEPILRRA